MKYCYECGGALQPAFLNEREGMVPRCSQCGRWQFEVFSVAVSMIVLSPDAENILLIQQYGTKNNVLVAGYINKGENAENAVIREVKEETGLTVVYHNFNKSEYFPRTNTLMFNFVCVADSEDLSGLNTKEVDKAQWFTIEEAIENIMPNSLAQKFLLASIGGAVRGGVPPLSICSHQVNLESAH